MIEQPTYLIALVISAIALATVCMGVWALIKWGNKIIEDWKRDPENPADL